MPCSTSPFPLGSFNGLQSYFSLHIPSHSAVHMDSFLSHLRKTCSATGDKVLLPVLKAEGEAQLFMD